jgi:hypothetical protein
MSIIELSGVCGDSDLETTITPGPSPSSSLDKGYYLWPEVYPGWFRAGSGTTLGGLDYLFSREARAILGPCSGLVKASQEINRTHGPTIALYYTLSSGMTELNSIKTIAISGFPQRGTSGWTELTYAPCRDRLYKDLSSWVLAETLSNGDALYICNITAETNGWGPSGYAIPTILSDSLQEWRLLGTYDDIKQVGVAGAKEWGKTSSGQFVIKIRPPESVPSDLKGSWIAGQVTLDWEELATTTELGVPLTVASHSTFSDLEIEYIYGDGGATGATVTVDGIFPRYAQITGLPADNRVVVRYKPAGVYGLAEGDSGGVIATRLPSTSQHIVSVRYESSTPKERFSGGRPGGWTDTYPIAVSPLTTPPGYYIGVAPGHPLHPTQPGPGVGFGTAPNGSKVLAWCIPSTIYTHGSPGKVRAVVLGPDGIPIPGVDITFVPGLYIYSNVSTTQTNIWGEAFTTITRIDTGLAGSTLNATTTLKVQLWTNSMLVDEKTLTIVLGPQLSTEEYTKKLYTGNIYMTILPGRAKSGRSRRLRIALWRRAADGSPNDGSLGQVQISCSNGRLFPEPSSRFFATNSAGGKLLYIGINNQENWADSPIYFEYEPTNTGEADVIYASWAGIQDGFDNAYGQLLIGADE